MWATKPRSINRRLFGCPKTNFRRTVFDTASARLFCLNKMGEVLHGNSRQVLQLSSLTCAWLPYCTRCAAMYVIKTNRATIVPGSAAPGCTVSRDSHRVIEGVVLLAVARLLAELTYQGSRRTTLHCRTFPSAVLLRRVVILR